MISFQQMIGHDEIIRHLKNTIKNGNVSHSYIITGAAGAGKKTIASAFAAGLQCRSTGDRPCMVCESCKKAIGNNHPDIRTVIHEKPGLISISEIREQVIHDVAIRPYESPYKIYIIPDAEMLNAQAQNALLKTIEEPPEYAVILLLTNSIESLLPTIRSRCIRLDLKVVDDRLIKQYLMEHLHVPDYRADIDVSFAHGSVGRAKAAATSQEFTDLTQHALRILKYSGNMEVAEMTEYIRSLCADRTKIEEHLDIFQFWFRDVLMFKATQEIDHLVFKTEITFIREQAGERSYENLEKILEGIEKTKVRLKANVNPELALELLFLTIRERT